MGVGDLLNSGSNAVVVINAEARCSIFNIEDTDRSGGVSVRMGKDLVISRGYSNL